MKARGMGMVTVVTLSIVVAAFPVVGVAADEPAGSISVSEWGVGTGVENHELQGEAEQFPEDITVVFWTRVVGGNDGDRIEHVWMRGDVEVVSIGLGIGGSHWRTYSKKMLHPGSAGDWAVEARDMDGNVLARSTFRCVAAE